MLNYRKKMPGKFRRRRTYKKKSKSAYAIAKQALRKATQVSKAQELKHYDLNFLGPYSLDWYGSAISMNVGINQGLEDSDRVGDEIYCLGIRCKFCLDINTSDRALCRFILIWDKEDTITTADSFLQTTGSVNVINSPFLVDERHRYILLKDKIVRLNQGDHRVRQVSMSKKLNKKTQFEAGTTNVSKGRLKLFLFSNIDATVAGRPQYSGWSRLWYRDS